MCLPPFFLVLGGLVKEPHILTKRTWPLQFRALRSRTRGTDASFSVFLLGPGHRPPTQENAERVEALFRALRFYSRTPKQPSPLHEQVSRSLVFLATGLSIGELPHLWPVLSESFSQERIQARAKSEKNCPWLASLL